MSQLQQVQKKIAFFRSSGDKSAWGNYDFNILYVSSGQPITRFLGFWHLIQTLYVELIRLPPGEGHNFRLERTKGLTLLFASEFFCLHYRHCANTRTFSCSLSYNRNQMFICFFTWVVYFI